MPTIVPEQLSGAKLTGRSSLSPALAHIVEFLQNPLVGAVLGLLCAVALLYSSRASFRRIQPDDAPTGLALAALSLFARLAGATLALWAYKTYLTPGFKPFAFALAGGFFVLYTIEVVRYSGVLKKRRAPASVRQ